MALALHHSSITFHSNDAAPHALRAFIDNHSIDVIDSRPRHKGRHVDKKRRIERSESVENEALGSQPETGMRPKARTQPSPTNRQSQNPEGEKEKTWLTLARVNIRLVLGKTANASYPSPEPESYHQELAIRLQEFRQLGPGYYNCQLVSPSGGILLDAPVRSNVSSQTLNVLQEAMGLACLKKPSFRSKFVISNPRRKEMGGEGTTYFNLCARIQALESATIHEAYLGQALKTSIKACLPKVLQSSFEPWSPRDFYDSVNAPARDNAPNLPLVDDLKCKLLPFQERAVRWMLQREEGIQYNSEESLPNALPYGFLECIDGDGSRCFASSLLGVITTHSEITRRVENSLKGGILSEEMGLGKTVEMIALICLNTKQAQMRTEDEDKGPQASRATLIITPPAILQQWKHEIEAIAPDLHVYIYDGLRAEAEKANHEELLRHFSMQDIVLTTFNVLSKEIHYAEIYERNLRHEKRYERRLSPLTRTMWWRVVLDEAQMIEGGVSNAAKVATLIPRVHAWCVSGTPVKKDYNDIFGLLLFLRYRPYSELPKLWSRLVLEHKPIFKQIVNELALRHTKEQIKDELHLPAQKRVVITMPFTHIEEQHYSTMFQEMAEDCGLDINGGPLSDDWDPESSVVISKMRMWLTRLRQTCLHPEVGTRNRRALGGRGPLRTVNEVLEVMIEQNQTASRADERTLFLSQLRRGQILEHADQPQKALDIWGGTLKEVEVIVRECRNQLATAVQQENDPTQASPSLDMEDDDVSSRALPYRLRLRNALELEHMCIFFIGNSYFQLKEQEAQKTLAIEAASDFARENQSTGGTDQNSTTTENPKASGQPDTSIDPTIDKEHDQKQTTEVPKSQRYLELEREEEAAYERAKSLRKEILAEARGKADIPIGKIKEKIKLFTEIPRITSATEKGGIELRRVCEKVEALLKIMQSQTKQLEEWRGKTAELLTLPLVDETETDAADDADVVGKEYETSTKQQDESYVYVDAFRALVSDRHDILTGQRNLLIEHEMKVALAEAKNGNGHAPKLLQELLQKRKLFKPSEEIGSVRGLLTQLRELKTDLRGAAERNNSRAAAEILIINKVLTKLQQISTEQSKVMISLDREVELFKDTMNLRLEFYRQLQAISDSVAPYEEDLTDQGRTNTLRNKEATEESLRSRIATLKSKGRYLVHLRNEASDSDTQRMCIICQHTFENGILTSCGHTYCLECLQLWWSSHRTCPACKKHLHRQDFHPITYKPQEMTMEEESGLTPTSLRKSDVVVDTRRSGIYSGIRENILNQIKNVDLEGSFGTKIDTMARHILWIREHDPGAKSIVFSQYKDFLDVLARAFKQFRIGFTSIDRKGGIENFRNDPGIECFFLHAKAHSSGLNLVNATHVLLCEPLINTAIELQAIARVHRIGQQHETTVWMYLVEGTVEKSIYDISVQRRLSHLGHVNAAGSSNDADTVLESQIEAANTLEMEDTALSDLLTKGSGGGEMVPPEDLWDCLFRQHPGRSGAGSEDAQGEIARQLGADAAEARMADVDARS